MAPAAPKFELKAPRRKKHCRNVSQNNCLPLGETIAGRFNGLAVLVDDRGAQQRLNRMGFFGKGNLSRSGPSFRPPDNVDVVRRRQMCRRAEWDDKYRTKKSFGQEKLLVVDDSDSNEDEQYVETKVEFCCTSCRVKEALQLSLEEAYFLYKYVGCLKIDELTHEECWTLFCTTDDDFVQRYVVYHYFKSRNWVVKAGIKFGVDFLLYKQGPPFYHASYLVKVETIYEKDDWEYLRDMTAVQGLNRLAGTTAKELLICQVLWPKTLTLECSTTKDCLQSFSVNEILIRRWKPSQDKES